MFNNTIDTKPIFTKPDGTVVRDLTQTMLNLKSKSYVTYKLFKVPRDYIMRPDLISKAVYNNTLYAEIILKYNGISNPFSINEGDLILIPDLNDAEQKIKTPEESLQESRAQKIRNSYKYIDPLKIPAKYKKNGSDSGDGSDSKDTLQTYNERQLVDAPASALPPNFSQPGTNQVRYKGGRVYFGEGAETCLQNGITTGEFLTSVIRSNRTSNQQ